MRARVGLFQPPLPIRACVSARGRPDLTPGIARELRKRDLRRLCRKSRVPFMREVQTFPNDRCCSSTAASSVSKVSCPSAWPRATRAGRAGIGSRPSAPIGSASTPSAGAYSRVRASPSRRKPRRRSPRKRQELARLRASLSRLGLRPGLAAAFKAQEQALAAGDRGA